MTQDNDNAPRHRGWVKATPGVARSVVIVVVGGCIAAMLLVPPLWRGVTLLASLVPVYLARVFYMAIVDVHADNLERAKERTPAQHTDLFRICTSARYIAGFEVLCRLGIHWWSKAGMGCLLCDAGAPKEEVYRVVLVDGTVRDVPGISPRDARMRVVYGDNAELADPEDWDAELFSEGGEGEPLAEVRVHPSKIASVRKREEVLDAQ